jgi:hypothetical protein
VVVERHDVGVGLLARWKSWFDGHVWRPRAAIVRPGQSLVHGGGDRRAVVAAFVASLVVYAFASSDAHDESAFR